MTTSKVLTPEQQKQWENDGFLTVSALFSPEETTQLREHFMRIQNEALAENSPLRPFYAPQSAIQSKGDVLKQFPRILHPHRFDAVSMETMLSERVGAVLSELFGEEPLAAQSMLYFKPPGARGQAMHQDNFYLNVRPGTCIAAWLSLDDADDENGGMSMVPGSHRLGVQCPQMADMAQSFTTELVPVPTGMQAVPTPLKAGDALFFNGSVIHGSTPNSSQNRFRRAFICHYVGFSTTAMNANYFPLFRFNGEKVTRETVEGWLNTCGAEDWESYNRLRNQWIHNNAAV